MSGVAALLRTDSDRHVCNNRRFDITGVTGASTANR